MVHLRKKIITTNATILQHRDENLNNDIFWLEVEDIHWKFFIA